MNLKKSLGSSTLWMSLAATGNSAVSFIIFIVLSRILMPRDIGLVAFALIVVEIGKIIVNAGFSQAVVQRETWDDTFGSTCFYLNLLASLIISLLVVFIVAPLTGHYYEPQAEPIVKVLSIIFFMEGLNAVHEGKLKREFSFRVIALRTVVGSLASGVLGIYLALHGYGVWALVCQQLISQFLISLITQVSTRWLPKLTFSMADARQLFAFSAPLMVAQIISNISSKLFELFVGLVIGPAALGFYRVGGRALYILQDIVLKPLEYTSLSALARITQPAEQAQSCMRIMRMSAYLTLPIFFGAAAVAPEFIVFAFGEKWAMSGQVMTILAIGIAPTVIGQQINSAFTASGNSRLVMRLAVINFIANCALAAATVPFGLIATAWGFTLRNYLTIVVSVYLFRQLYGVAAHKIFNLAAPSIISSAIMLAGVMLIKILAAPHLPMLALFATLCCSGAIIYALCIGVIFKRETQLFFNEGADLAPVKLKPLFNGIQNLINYRRTAP